MGLGGASLACGGLACGGLASDGRLADALDDPFDPGPAGAGSGSGGSSDGLPSMPERETCEDNPPFRRALPTFAISIA